MEDEFENSKSLPDDAEILTQQLKELEDHHKVYQELFKKINGEGQASGEVIKRKQKTLEAAIAFFEALIRLGQIIGAIPNKHAQARAGQKTLPPGVSPKLSHQAQLMAAYPDLVRSVIREKVAQEDFPTINAVMVAIAAQKEKKIEVSQAVQEKCQDQDQVENEKAQDVTSEPRLLRKNEVLEKHLIQISNDVIQVGMLLTDDHIEEASPEDRLGILFIVEKLMVRLAELKTRLDVQAGFEEV